MFFYYDCCSVRACDRTPVWIKFRFCINYRYAVTVVFDLVIYSSVNSFKQRAEFTIFEVVRAIITFERFWVLHLYVSRTPGYTYGLSVRVICKTYKLILRSGGSIREISASCIRRTTLKHPPRDSWTAVRSLSKTTAGQLIRFRFPVFVISFPLEN